ncbi:MAG: chromate resistance protein [Pseudolabrys sp.]|nr:chromate resistance protein [Pseudolabrys sp.]
MDDTATNDFLISPRALWQRIGTPLAPQIIDTHRRPIFDALSGVIPGAAWRDTHQVESWATGLDRARPIVVACAHGEQMSQIAVAHLRGEGFAAQALEGGHDAWVATGLPLVDKKALARFAPKSPSVWVTRRRPKIDRVACPWLIRRFIDPQALILFVDPARVPETAKEIGAVPFDIDGVELSHEGPRCSFDTMLKIFGLESEPALARLALIVRGADTGRPDLAPEAAGLLAVSLGLSALAGDDDHGLLRRGFMVYDALFAWLRHAADERHNWPAKARS